MAVCIYCEEDKPQSEMTLEHIIPQCLGGAYAPDIFKTKRVCRRCNNNLGQFVDAAFEREFFVRQWLQSAAVDCYDPASPYPLPLLPMGLIDIPFPHMEHDEVCEMHLGPLGELVLWVRPNDENLYWYMGGNPITAKQRTSRAYFLFSEKTEKNIQITLWSFANAFSGMKVRKVLATMVNQALPDKMGFSTSDDLDDKRTNFILQNLDLFKKPNLRVSTNTEFDVRFMAKLARGIGFALLGDEIMSDPYSREIKKGIWYNMSRDEAPVMYGGGMFTQMGAPGRLPILARKGAVVISAMDVGEAISLDLRLGDGSGATIRCTDNAEAFRRACPHWFGISIVLYKFLRKCVVLPIAEYIAHVTGDSLNADLLEVDMQIERSAGYFRNL